MKSIFIFFTFLFATSNLFGAYHIKIAVYKDHANLMRFIAKVPGRSYRKNIHIKKQNHLYYVTATYNDEAKAKQALHAYKKAFPDAFIERDNVVQAKASIPKAVPKETAVEPSFKEDNKTVEIAEEKVPDTLDAKGLLSHKTVYVCKEKIEKVGKQEVIKLEFNEENVMYSKPRRDIPPLALPCTFEQDTVSVTMSDINFTYKIEKEAEDFLAIQSFVNKHKNHRLRYYFDEAVAWKYIKSKLQE